MAVPTARRCSYSARGKSSQIESQHADKVGTHRHSRSHCERFTTGLRKGGSCDEAVGPGDVRKSTAGNPPRVGEAQMHNPTVVYGNSPG